MRYSPLSVVLCLLFLTHSALAQTTVSTIEGTIRDAQGSVVSGAQVVVKSPALGIERTATTDADGFYRITALPAGDYSLTVSHTRILDAHLRQHRADTQPNVEGGHSTRSGRRFGAGRRDRECSTVESDHAFNRRHDYTATDQGDADKWS